MSQLEDAPDKGDVSEQTTLDVEESRCMAGLKKYWMVNQELPEAEAERKAWEDLKTEFERLAPFKWYK